MVKKIYDFADKEIKKSTDPKELDTKENLIILDGVKDHLIPRTSEKSSTHEMWKTLQDLFQNKNENRLLVLKDKLKSTKMLDGEGVASYLTRLSQVHDEHAAISEIVLDSKTVRVSLKGFTEEWKLFIKGIVTRETQPKWSRLWDDFI